MGRCRKINDRDCRFSNGVTCSQKEGTNIRFGNFECPLGIDNIDNSEIMAQNVHIEHIDDTFAIDVLPQDKPIGIGDISKDNGSERVKTWYVVGNYAYVTSYLSDCLEIIDISNPANPSHAGRLNHSAGGAGLDGAIKEMIEKYPGRPLIIHMYNSRYTND